MMVMVMVMMLIVPMSVVVIMTRTNDLFTVGADLAVHVANPVQQLFDPVYKAISQTSSIVEMTGLEDLHTRERRYKIVGRGITAAHNVPGKQETREHYLSLIHI